MLFTMHGKMDPQRWADFFPHVVHVHGKFYGIVDGDDPSIDWPAVARVLVEQGYDGFISSEYEAHAYSDRYNAFDQLRAQHDMLKRLLESAASPVAAPMSRRPDHRHRSHRAPPTPAGCSSRPPTCRCSMVEAGPVVSTPPRHERQEHRRPAEQRPLPGSASQGPGDRSPGTAGLPGGTAAEGTVTARFGTYSSAAGARTPAACPRPPCPPASAARACTGPAPPRARRAASGSTSCPTSTSCSTRRRRCCTSPAAPSGTRRRPPRSWSASVRSSLRTGSPSARCRWRPTRAPTARCAGAARTSSSARWPRGRTATGSSCGPTRSPSGCCREGDRVVGAVLRDQSTGAEEEVRADAVVVAANAFGTPQLLWTSGIRPEALGRYLTEHPLIFGIVAVREGVLPPPDRDSRLQTDPIRGVVSVVFGENHPFHAQLMYSPVCPVPLPEGSPHRDNPAGYAMVGYGVRKFPRPEDRLTFDESTPDENGLPGIVVSYDLTEREHAEIEQAKKYQARAAGVLGEFVENMPRLMPPGTLAALHGHVPDGAGGRRHERLRPRTRGSGASRAWCSRATASSRPRTAATRPSPASPSPSAARRRSLPTWRRTDDPHVPGRRRRRHRRQRPDRRGVRADPERAGARRHDRHVRGRPDRSPTRRACT